MSWQPGDVSPDARRAAEAAAEAAGVPLKDWFAETVRAAIIRELGHSPAEEPESKPAARVPEPTRPAVEPVVPPPIAEPQESPESVVRPEPLLLEPVATAESPPIIPSEPTAPEPLLATAPPDPPPIVEPAPPAPEPIAAAEPPAPAPVVEPEPPAPIKEPQATRYPTQGVSLGVLQLADSRLSSWLATRIQGLPATVGAAALGTETPPAPPAPPHAPPTPAAGPRAPLLDLVPPAPPPPVPYSPPPQPAPVPAAPPPRAPSAAVPPAPAILPLGTSLPLSLPTGPVKTLPLASLRPARIRARRPSDTDAAVAALAASVASQGVREPILVRRLVEKAEQYEVVAGERRRLAAERAGRTDLPAVIVEADDAEALTLSLAENLGRGDFSPLDEARAYLRLLTEYRVGPGTLAQRLARERSHIVLALRLLGLPPKVRQLIDGGRLAPAQAYALLSAPDPESLAEQMIQAIPAVPPARL